MPLPSLFEIRLWLGDLLFKLAAWVMPEHRYNSRTTEDGMIQIWREPAQ